MRPPAARDWRSGNAARSAWQAFHIGYWSRRRTGGSVGRSLADGAIDLAFGLLIVALKLLID